MCEYDIMIIANPSKNSNFEEVLYETIMNYETNSESPIYCCTIGKNIEMDEDDVVFKLDNCVSNGFGEVLNSNV